MLTLLSKRLSVRPAKDELSLKESRAFVEALDLSKRLEREIHLAAKKSNAMNRRKFKRVRESKGSSSQDISKNSSSKGPLGFS
jgi:hypothetical protein